MLKTWSNTFARSNTKTMGPSQQPSKTHQLMEWKVRPRLDASWQPWAPALRSDCAKICTLSAARDESVRNKLRKSTCFWTSTLAIWNCICPIIQKMRTRKTREQVPKANRTAQNRSLKPCLCNFRALWHHMTMKSTTRLSYLSTMQLSHSLTQPGASKFSRKSLIESKTINSQLKTIQSWRELTKTDFPWKWEHQAPLVSRIGASTLLSLIEFRSLQAGRSTKRICLQSKGHKALYLLQASLVTLTLTKTRMKTANLSIRTQKKNFWKGLSARNPLMQSFAEPRHTDTMKVWSWRLTTQLHRLLLNRPSQWSCALSANGASNSKTTLTCLRANTPQWRKMKFQRFRTSNLFRWRLHAHKWIAS